MPFKDYHKSLIEEIVFLYIPLLTLLIPTTFTEIKEWGIIQLILLSLYISLFYTYSFIRGRTIKIGWFDGIWLVFILICFLSYFWAIDGTRIWANAFGWVGYFLFMVKIRSISFTPITYRRLSLVLMFIFTIIFIAAILRWIVGIDIENWSMGIYLHSNHTGMLLLCLWTLLCFNQYINIDNWLALLVAILILIVAILSLSLGVSIFTGFLICLILIKKVKANPLLVYIPVAAIGVAFVYIAYYQGEWLSVQSASNTIEVFFDDSLRLNLMRNSLRLFVENPLLGIGLDNWHIQVFKYGMDDFDEIVNVSTFITPVSHNLPLKILAELGIFGFLALGVTLTIPALNVLSLRKMDFTFAWVLCIFFFIAGTMLYANATFNHMRISQIQIIAFFGLGVISKNISILKFGSPQPKSLMLILLSISCLGWNYYAFRGSTEISKAIALSKSNPEEALSKMKKIFHPVFRAGYSQFELIPLAMARLYMKTNHDDEAEAYYLKGLKMKPYDVNVLYNIGVFYKQKQDYEKAREIGLKAYNLSSVFWKPRILLAEIELVEQNYSKSLQYLSYMEELDARILRLTNRVNTETEFRKRRQLKLWLTQCNIIKARTEKLINEIKNADKRNLN